MAHYNACSHTRLRSLPCHSAKTCSERSSQLELACKLGAARELYEETGLDLRSSLDRIIPASLRAAPVQENGRELLVNEHKNRLFFFVPVNDQDFPSSGVMPMGNEGRHLRVRPRINAESQRNPAVVSGLTRCCICYVSFHSSSCRWNTQAFSFSRSPAKPPTC